ncbi:hypothetical protein L1987_42408 [Smallanthus sonchifolius]|uniref:Uncharacterized protein n=1 Tax=Smallanthus sonchifolius TaxID=185202 RepID=A0ACB9GIQ0_9ASTR|nr:hypothetical protein L1987_42408 [Smallanthus sonchifolius]
MDISLMGFDTPFFRDLHHILNATAYENAASNKSNNAGLTGAYFRDARAMGATPTDVEEDNVLVISGERKREHDLEEKEGMKYVRMERRVGKLMRKFTLPENANTDKISVICQDGMLTVTVEKRPPQEPKKPKTIQVQVA